MPTTRSRAAWIPLALTWWRRQTWPNRELVVVTDGDPVQIEVGTHEAIRVHHMLRDPSGPPTLGAKWNAGYALARGDYHCPWADDDWHRADSIELRMNCVLLSGARRIGCASMLFWDISARKAFRFIRSNGFAWWVPHGTLITHRRVWDRHPYPEWQRNSDGGWQALTRGRVVLVQDDGYYVAFRHGGNNWKTTCAGPGWRPLTASLPDLIGRDARLIPREPYLAAPARPRQAAEPRRSSTLSHP